ncbi:MAG: HD domain-containing protein [Gammaproteobacteria bacterium]
MELILLKAFQFAALKHRDQRRKDHEASPYINHPIAVALILVETGAVRDPDVLSAAILHDTLEDTQTTAAELEAAFGPAVRRLVEEVTDDKTLPKAERKRCQIEHASALSPGAALVKLGDKIANVHDVQHAPPSAWSLERRREYLEWAEAVVRNLPKVNTALEERFALLIEEGRRRLR